MTDTHLSKNDADETIPFFPDHVRTEAWVAVGVLVIVGIIGFLALFNPVGVGDPADALNTPAHVKPEWYFLALYQILKYIPPVVLGMEGKVLGSTLPVILVALIAIWPFLDRKPDQSRSIYKKRGILMVVVTVILIALTIWGEVS